MRDSDKKMIRRPVFHIAFHYLFFVLFPPYHLLVPSDFSEIKKEEKSECNNINLDKYVKNFSIIEHYLTIPSASSHYQVFCKLIFELITTKDKKCVEALNDFVKVMPEYPFSLIKDPFSANVIHTISSYAPSVLLSMVSKNPNLIPPDTDIALCRDCLLMNSIQEENDMNKISVLIDQLRDQLTKQAYIDLAPNITKMLETLINNHDINNISPSILSFIMDLIPIIPEPILHMKLPISKTSDLKFLTPNAHQNPKTMNSSFFSNILLYRFAYDHVLNLEEYPRIESVIPLHRLSLSGCAPLAALIFSLNYLEDKVKAFIKKADIDTKIVFGSLLSCIFSCVEIPELEKYVLSSKDYILPFFENLILTTKSIAMHNTFQSVINLLKGQGTSPIAQVYSCWMLNPHKFQMLNTMLSISPLDPCFSALLKKLTSDTLNYPFTICKIVKKVMIVDSLANSSALQTFVNTCCRSKSKNSSLTYIDFIKFANTIINTEYYFYAIHFISLFETIDEPINSIIQESLSNLIVFSLLSETNHSASHLESFSKYISLLSEESLIYILNCCQKHENVRIYSRLLLMITYSNEFSTKLSSKTNFIQNFFLIIQNLLNSSNKLVFNASIVIAWHNLYLSIVNNPTAIKNKYIQQLFTLGGRALVKLWDSSEIHHLIVESFCNAVELPEARSIIISLIGAAQGRDDKFVDTLIYYDSNAAYTKYPGLKGKIVRSINNPPPTKWGAQYWVQYAFSEIRSVML